MYINIFKILTNIQIKICDAKRFDKIISYMNLMCWPNS